jgi:hypothetical protein
MSGKEYAQNAIETVKEELPDMVTKLADAVKGSNEQFAQAGATAADSYVGSFKRNLNSGLADAAMNQNRSAWLWGNKLPETMNKGAAHGVIKNNPGLTVAEGIKPTMPHSDAKKGPLSRLTASGIALVDTMADGMEKNKGRFLDAAKQTFDYEKEKSAPIANLQHSVVGAQINPPESAKTQLKSTAYELTQNKIQKEEHKQNTVTINKLIELNLKGSSLTGTKEELSRLVLDALWREVDAAGVA